VKKNPTITLLLCDVEHHHHMLIRVII
jgi:hypothetical protein